MQGWLDRRGSMEGRRLGEWGQEEEGKEKALIN